MADFDRVYERLGSILEPYGRRMHVLPTRLPATASTWHPTPTATGWGAAKRVEHRMAHRRAGG